MDICTFQFMSDKTFKRVAWELLETPFSFSVCYGEIHYGLPRCITVWGAKAIETLVESLKDANLKYKVVV